MERINQHVSNSHLSNRANSAFTACAIDTHWMIPFAYKRQMDTGEGEGELALFDR